MKNKIILTVLAVIVLGIAIALVAKGGKGPTINPNASPVAQCNQFCTGLAQACKDQCSEIKCACFSKSTSISPRPNLPDGNMRITPESPDMKETNEGKITSCNYTDPNSCNADQSCVWACYPANPITLPGGYTCSLNQKEEIPPSVEPSPVTPPAPAPEPVKGCCLSENNEYTEKCLSFSNENDCKIKGNEAGFSCYWSYDCTKEIVLPPKEVNTRQ